MRILLVTEGPSDEPVAEGLVRHLFKDAHVYRKSLKARGFAVVSRELKTWIEAAYFGHYDLLVVHFDLDDSVSKDFLEVSESKRWQEIHSSVDTILKTLAGGGRKEELRIALMAPCQSTEAWLAWGLEDKDGREWEKRDRHLLKRRLFGDPPRSLVKKSERLVTHLMAQMKSHDKWPRSLRNFMSQLEQSHQGR